ncbi:MAG TPA: CPBP family intramembrane glutamic endopeptidase [Candidatus Dormibacteraeota bacterium]|nr:CPBP family intramembrane glutamic endopeptidase [Candidatus Dormibacteraeota bacterium]
MSDGIIVKGTVGSQTTSTSKTNAYLIGSEASVFSISGLQLRLWPILATIGLGLLVVLPSGYVFFLLTQHTSKTETALPVIANHAVMLLIAVALIAWFSRGNLSEYGLQWPKHRHYVPSALLWGAAFGLLMTVVDYFPQILRHIPPPDNLALTPRSIGGWFFFEWIFVGPTEEIPFRGLLQTFLMQRTSGRVRFWKYEMHVAGVVLALLFALAHLTSFWTENFWIALGQQIYAFALGILYAYWREKSESLLAPIIGHNVGDGVEYVLMFLMTWAWR